MNWIVNCSSESFNIILFDYDNRKWEIVIDPNLTDSEISSLISKRQLELQSEFLTNGSYDYSDLIVDYTKKEELDGNENN